MNKPRPGVSPLLQNLLSTLPENPRSEQPGFSEDLPSLQIESKPGSVRFAFSKPVHWFAFSSADARNIARTLISHANAADGLNEDGSPKIVTPPGIILPP